MNLFLCTFGIRFTRNILILITLLTSVIIIFVMQMQMNIRTHQPLPTRTHQPLPTRYINCQEKIDGEAPDMVVTNRIISSFGLSPKYRLCIVMTKEEPTVTEAIEYAAMRAHNDRRVLIVADTKTPSDWTYPNCTILRPFQLLHQHNKSKINYAIKKFPDASNNSMIRKAYGYLFAVENGAEFIYSVDDGLIPYLANDNSDERYMKNFHFHSILEPRLSAGRFNKTPVTANTIHFFNPSDHFGQLDIRLRGYPTQLTNRSWLLQLNINKPEKPAAIQHSLIDYDFESDIDFDPIAPPVNLAPGVYAPFDGRNTLYRYEAFWALAPLASSINFKLADIWHGYWALRLLWEIGETLAFYPPNAHRRKVVAKAFKGFETDHRTMSLVRALEKWQCSKDAFESCALDLANMMAEKKFWLTEDARLIEIWFKDLSSAGYQFPKLKKRTGNVPAHLNTSVSYFSTHSISYERILEQTVSDYSNMCRAPVIFQYRRLRRVDHFKNTVLVFVYNREYGYFNRYNLKRIYLLYFAHIIFCSPFPEDELFLEFVTDAPFIYRYSYININMTDLGPANGSLHYICAIRAIALGIQNVDGYYFVRDDVLINAFNPIDTTKFHASVSVCTVPESNKTGQHPKSMQTVSNRAAMDRMKAVIEQESDATFNRLLKHQQIILLELLSFGIVCEIDIYYVPSSVAPMFARIMERFWYYKIPGEFVVHPVMASLGWREPFERLRQRRSQCLDDLRGISVTMNEKIIYAMDGYLEGYNVMDGYLNRSNHYIHPFQVTRQEEEKFWKKSFCRVFVMEQFHET